MSQRAFSLIELIGVIAILVILTAVVLPRVKKGASDKGVIQTVNEAHLAETVVALQGLEAVTAAHVAQFGFLASLNGRPLNGAYEDFGQILLTEGLLEKPFHLTIGTNCLLRLHQVSTLTATSPIDGNNGAYDLDQNGSNDVIGATHVVEIVIFGVSEAEARELNRRIDGAQANSAGGQGDFSGRLIYGKPGPDGRTDVLIHIAHK